jgi:hypothetical protein
MYGGATLFIGMLCGMVAVALFTIALIGVCHTTKYGGNKTDYALITVFTLGGTLLAWATDVTLSSIH